MIFDFGKSPEVIDFNIAVTLLDFPEPVEPGIAPWPWVEKIIYLQKSRSS